jgi:hypothetical protein
MCARATRSLPIDCRAAHSLGRIIYFPALSVGHNLWLFSWQRKNPDAPRSVFLQLKERAARLKGLRWLPPLEFLCFALSHRLGANLQQSLYVCALKAQSAIARHRHCLALVINNDLLGV